MAAPAPAPAIVGELLAIPTGLIEMGDRLRPVDPVWAQALAGVMKAEGQHTPIDVCRLPGKSNYRLVTGAHRLTAARIAGLLTVKALLVDADHLTRRMQEMSENLWRSNLQPLERAAFVAELVALQKSRSGVAADQDGRKRSAEVRWQRTAKTDANDASHDLGLAYGWADTVGDHIGISRKSIYRDLALHRGIAPDVSTSLRGHRLAGNAGQLRALARMTPEDQRQAVSLILGGHATTVSQASDTILQKPTPSPETKAWSAFIGGWSRMSAAKRRDALRELENLGLPKGVRITFDGDAK